MTARQANHIENLFHFLTELKSITIGPGWSRVKGSLAKSHSVNDDYLAYAVRGGIIERNPDKNGMYRWVNETDVTHKMAHDLWQSKMNKVKPAKRGPKPSFEVFGQQFTSDDIRSFNDIILINDLKRRGYTGTITPPKPLAITL